MAAIPGVTLKKNSKGQLTHIIIDVRKHLDAIPVVRNLGLVLEMQLHTKEKNSHTVEQFTIVMEDIITKHYGNNH